MTFELLDDQLASVALQEALAFIDAYDILGSAAANDSAQMVPIAPAPAAVVSFGPVVPPPQTLPKPRAQRRSGKDGVQTKPTRVRNRSRGDQKAELERLRHDVKMLGTKLARLKGTSESQQPYGSPGSVSTTSVSNSSEDESLEVHQQQLANEEDTLVSMWKNVALRQFQRRNHSEMTNRKLKLVLAKQLKLAKTLEGLYSRRTTQNDLELVYDSRAAISHHGDVHRLGRTDAMSTLLLNHVQQLRFEIDIHFLNSGLKGPEGRMLRTQTKPDLYLGTIQETTSCAPLPIAMEDAERVLWTGMAMHFKAKPGGPPKNVDIVDGGMDKSFVTSVKGVQYSYDMVSHSVTRKYVEKDRVIYAWTNIGTIANQNVRYLGEGLIVLERSSAAPASSTLLKNWHRVHAEQLDSPLTPSSASVGETERFKVTGLKTLSQNTAAYFSALENVLMEAASNKFSFEPFPLCVT